MIDPDFGIKRTVTGHLDRLFDAIEPWLDGGEEEPISARANDLPPVETYGVTPQVDDNAADPMWQALTPDGLTSALQRIGEKSS